MRRLVDLVLAIWLVAYPVLGCVLAVGDSPPPGARPTGAAIGLDLALAMAPVWLVGIVLLVGLRILVRRRRRVG